jgi:N-acetylglutamate synthase-like GNAT family acetyltransferase
MDETEPPPEVDERLADVLAESLLDIWLREQRAKRARRTGRPAPESEPVPPDPTAPSEAAPEPAMPIPEREPSAPRQLPRKRKRASQPQHLRPPWMYRRYHDATADDLDLVAPLLAPQGLTRQDLAAPANRIFVVQRVTREVTGVGVLDKHGPVGVLRAVVVAPKVRRLTHGSLLATQLLKRVHYERVLNVYALGLVPEFLDALGFAELQRADVPRLVFALPGLAGSTLPIFEIAPRADGAIRTRSRRYPKTLTELLAMPDTKRQS